VFPTTGKRELEIGVFVLVEADDEHAFAHLRDTEVHGVELIFENRESGAGEESLELLEHGMMAKVLEAQDVLEYEVIDAILLVQLL